MYLTNLEREMPLLHQLIPLAAVQFEKRDSRDVKLFSRCLVSSLHPVDEIKSYILGQLFYYKCTTGPIQALVINPKDKTQEVRH